MIDGAGSIEIFRRAIRTVRRFQAYLLNQIDIDTTIDEDERCLRRADVANTNVTLDEWERNTEMHLLQGVSHQEALQLIVMAKQLTEGIEEFADV